MGDQRLSANERGKVHTRDEATNVDVMEKTKGGARKHKGMAQMQDTRPASRCLHSDSERKKKLTAARVSRKKPHSKKNYNQKQDNKKVAQEAKLEPENR